MSVRDKREPEAGTCTVCDLANDDELREGDQVFVDRHQVDGGGLWAGKVCRLVKITGNVVYRFTVELDGASQRNVCHVTPFRGFVCRDCHDRLTPKCSSCGDPVVYQHGDTVWVTLPPRNAPTFVAGGMRCGGESLPAEHKAVTYLGYVSHGQKHVVGFDKRKYDVQYSDMTWSQRITGVDYPTLCCSCWSYLLGKESNDAQ